MTYTPLPVILDTDFSSDVGDLGAVGLTCAFARLGHIDLLGITCGTSHNKSPGAIDAVCTYFQLSPYPSISTWKGTSFDPTPATWSDHIYDNFSHPNGNLATTWPDGKSEMRRLLAARSSADAVIIAVGPLNAIADLLNSTSDGNSALSGSALVAAKCKALYVMGGYYPTNASAEFNFAQHPVSANDVFANWPTPIVACGYNIGWPGPKDGKTLAANKPSGNLLRSTYNAAGYSTGREAWDDMTVLAAVSRHSGFDVIRGTNSVNSSTGVNTWTTNTTGSHYYLTKAQSDAVFESKMNLILEADPTASPVLSSLASTAQWLTMG